MILYLDTSALVKLYVAEERSDEVRDRVRQATQVATSRLAYPEARSALARRQREEGLTAGEVRRAVSALDRDLGAFVMMELDEGVARLAGRLTDSYPLRGCDAVHLASAIEIGRLVGSLPVFLTFDPRQSPAAAAEHLPS